MEFIVKSLYYDSCGVYRSHTNKQINLLDLGVHKENETLKIKFNSLDELMSWISKIESDEGVIIYSNKTIVIFDDYMD